MDNAELYAIYNSMQRRSTEAVLAELSPIFHWADNERVLDIGCGPGDVTAQVLFPLLPPSASLVSIKILNCPTICITKSKWFLSVFLESDQY